MSEDKKDEILGKEKELDEGELEAVSGAKGDKHASCECVIAGFGGGKGGECQCFTAGSGNPGCSHNSEGKDVPGCFIVGDGSKPKP